MMKKRDKIKLYQVSWLLAKLPVLLYMELIVWVLTPFLIWWHLGVHVLIRLLRPILLVSNNPNLGLMPVRIEVKRMYVREHPADTLSKMSMMNKICANNI